MSVDPKTYPEKMPCCSCGYMWMQHKGTLCPKNPGYPVLISVDGHLEYIPVAPIWGDTTFIPDFSYFDMNIPFDVEHDNPTVKPKEIIITDKLIDNFTKV